MKNINPSDNPSYIGITGFTHQEQVSRLIMETIPGHTHKLMVGVLANDVTMRETKVWGRYVNKNLIPELFLKDNRVLNMIHFNTREKEKLLDRLVELVSIAGENLHGFQLNMRWPDPNVLYEFKKQFPEKKIVIQMEKGDFDDYRPKEMAEKLLEYENIGNYVILDMSGGAGIEMNPQKLIKYALAISEKTNFQLVFAGGLHSKNLHIIKPILKIFPNACIDAEGQLMNKWGSLDPEKTIPYLCRAISITSTSKRINN